MFFSQSKRTLRTAFRETLVQLKLQTVSILHDAVNQMLEDLQASKVMPQKMT
jgi:hypothetical protein